MPAKISCYRAIQLKRLELTINLAKKFKNVSNSKEGFILLSFLNSRLMPIVKNYLGTTQLLQYQVTIFPSLLPVTLPVIRFLHINKLLIQVWGIISQKYIYHLSQTLYDIFGKQISFLYIFERTIQKNKNLFVHGCMRSVSLAPPHINSVLAWYLQ